MKDESTTSSVRSMTRKLPNKWTKNEQELLAFENRTMRLHAEIGNAIGYACAPNIYSSRLNQFELAKSVLRYCYGRCGYALTLGRNVSTTSSFDIQRSCATYQPCKKFISTKLELANHDEACTFSSTLFQKTMSLYPLYWDSLFCGLICGSLHSVGLWLYG